MENESDAEIEDFDHSSDGDKNKDFDLFNDHYPGQAEDVNHSKEEIAWYGLE